MSEAAPTPPAAKPAPSKNLNLAELKASANKYIQKFSRHAVFAAVLAVLLAYLLVVYRISSLSNAEPTPDQTSTATNLIPKIDPTAINQIQALENNSTQVHALFDQARNNPFQE